MEIKFEDFEQPIAIDAELFTEKLSVTFERLLGYVPEWFTGDMLD